MECIALCIHLFHLNKQANDGPRLHSLQRLHWLLLLEGAELLARGYVVPRDAGDRSEPLAEKFDVAVACQAKISIGWAYSHRNGALIYSYNIARNARR